MGPTQTCMFRDYRTSRSGANCARSQKRAVFLQNAAAKFLRI
jgi:hypothetical protein